LRWPAVPCVTRRGTDGRSIVKEPRHTRLQLPLCRDCPAPSTPSTVCACCWHCVTCSQDGARGYNNVGDLLYVADASRLVQSMLTAFIVLQDPSVASAPLEKRIAFLQSKNLTQEEVDVSLARAAEDPSQPSSPPPQTPTASSNAYRPPPAAPYGSYPPQGYWQPSPPPEYAQNLGYMKDGC
jgi:hypothetical protein